MSESLTIALSKGRIFKEALPLLAAADIHPLEDPEQSRKLILPTNRPDVRLVIIRASDVPTYVEYGAADVGIAGRDVLMEQHDVDLYEPLDLGIGRCRMVVAEPAGLAAQDDPRSWERVRIATKYPHITRSHFSRKGVQTEIIKLYGSMELAPIVGLADYIVDLVDTGNTLRANGLEPLEHIAHISSRLIVNKAAMKMKHARVKALIEQLKSAVEK